MNMTRITMDRPQASPLAGPKSAPSPACIRMMTHATTLFSGSSACTS